MPGPWEDYQAAAEAGPWSDYTPAPRSRRGQRAPIAREVEGALANFNRGIPLGHDIPSVGRGLVEAGRNVHRQLTDGSNAPLDPFAIEAAFGRGFDQQLTETRGAAQDFRERRPNAAALSEGTGFALPMAMTAGAVAPEVMAAQGAQRGFPLFARQSAQAGSVGSAYGYAYGAGAPDQAGLPLEQRLQAGNEGAAFGAVAGLATPAAVNTLRATWNHLGSPAVRLATSAFRRVPTPDPNSVGAMGRPMRPPPRQRPAPQRPRVPAAAMSYVDRAAADARMTADQLEGALATARANPQGQVLNDVFGDAGVRKLRPIVQAPGETGGRATETLERRSQEMAERVTGSLRRLLGVNETPTAAMGRLRNEYDRVSAELYTPVLRQTLTAEQRTGLERTFNQFSEDPVFRDAVRRAEGIFARDRRLGLVTGEIDDNFARYAHYLKMGGDAAVQAAPIGSRGLQATEMRGVLEMQARIRSALDDNIPGYRQAREQWGGLAAAEDALTEGGRFLRMDSDEVAQRMAQMTEFERRHARIGLAHAIQRGVGLSGKATGNVNIANSRMLNAPEMQRRIRAAFETEEQAVEFLEVVRSQNELMRNATGWTGGSTTFGNFAHGEENATAAVAEGAVDMLRGEFGRAANRAGRQAWNWLADDAVKRSNNVAGEFALRRIDNAEAAEFTDAVVAELRRRQSLRAATSRASRVTAAGAGAAAGERRR